MRFVTFLLFVLLTSALVGQTESITDYRVTIEVQTDRSILVKEDITVHVLGEQIKRGITRAFPKRNDNAAPGQAENQAYDILIVTRDGAEEPYSMRSEGQNQVMYIGEKDVLLEPGTYTYHLEYTSPNQVALLEEMDEITWNAIGEENTLTTENAVVTVILPNGTTVIQSAAYTGAYGQQGTDFTKEELFSGEVTFKTTQPLAAGSGLTVSVGFPKGVTDQPGLVATWGSLLATLLGGLGFLFYGFTSWRKHGIDPPKPAVYPIFSPPNELSPAALSYLHHKMVTAKGLSASIISLAIKGYLTLNMEEKSGFFTKSKEYSIRKTDLCPPDTGSDLSSEEQRLYHSLFANSDDVLLNGTYNAQVGAAKTAHESAISQEHRAFLWEGHNLQRLIPLVLIYLATMGAGIFLSQQVGAAELALPFLIGFGILGFIGLFVYGYLINQPSPEKVKLQSEIEGFKLYLKMAEKDRLQLLNPPEMTVGHFEALLPYAFALGLQHNWSGKFSSILEAAHYQPSWNNNQAYFYGNSFGSDFESSVSGTANPPSESSGGSSGGGGFSGGGGGGGGVGGW